MDIAQYISDLLKEHDEVGLPGIGTFFKKGVSAYFNNAEGIYYPPGHKIDFRQDDGSSSILINHIVQSKHISEPSALYFIERFCENVQKSLDRNSNVDISPLGTLLITGDSYTLQSDSTSAGSKFFGLKPIKEFEVLSKASVASTSQDNKAISESVIEEVPSSNSKGIWITLAIVLLLGSGIALAYFYYPQYFKNLNFSSNKKPQNKVVKPVVAPVIKDSVSFADSLVKEFEQQGMQAEVEKAPDSVTISSNITTPDSLKVTAANPVTTYEIIVASSASKRDAEASVRRLRKKGIDAKVITNARRPKFKVSVGTFTSKNAADKEHSRIKKELIKDAWILTITNKKQ